MSGYGQVPQGQAGYGQPGQGQAGHGQAGYGQTGHTLPAAHGYFAPAAAAPRRRRRGGWAWFLLALLLTAAVAGGAGYLYGAGFGPRPLLAEEVDREVARVLQEDFGLTELSGVDCPDDLRSVQGAQFQCSFEYAGEAQSVPVTVGSEDGQLVVGSPR